MVPWRHGEERERKNERGENVNARPRVADKSARRADKNRPYQ